jgi:hypothetical protein
MQQLQEANPLGRRPDVVAHSMAAQLRAFLAEWAPRPTAAADRPRRLHRHAAPGLA